MAAAKPSFRQDLVWRLEALAYDVAVGFARLFPIDGVSDFGAAMFRRLGPLTRAHRTAKRNLEIAFPEATPQRIDDLLDEQWGNIGRWALEFPILDRIVADPGRVEVEGAERLTEIASGAAGAVVFISGHFASFELMPAVIIRAGIGCQITYRPTNNPYVDDRIRRSRFRYGVRLFAPKGTEGARELMRALARGESVALMNDQKFNGGIAAPLFGVMAHTAPGPSSFALRYGVPLQPMSVVRLEKARFKVIVHPPIHLVDTGDRTADIETGVRRVNAFIEDCVRAHPAQWFWVHRRWPGEAYQKS